MTEQEVVKVKVAKEPRFAKKWTPEKWQEHLKSLQKDAVPEGWLGMADIVKLAKEAGIKTSRICSAMGGDRAGGEVWDPVFQIFYVGGRKYGSPEILTKGFELLKDPEFHKQERKGRPKKEKIEGEVGGKKVKVKPMPGFKRGDVWTQKPKETEE